MHVLVINRLFSVDLFHLRQNITNSFESSHKSFESFVHRPGMKTMKSFVVWRYLFFLLKTLNHNCDMFSFVGTTYGLQFPLFLVKSMGSRGWSVLMFQYKLHSICINESRCWMVRGESLPLRPTWPLWHSRCRLMQQHVSIPLPYHSTTTNLIVMTANERPAQKKAGLKCLEANSM